MSDDRNVEEIRIDIEQNRDDMSRTIDQIEERLRPEALQAQVTEIVQRATDQLLAEFNEKANGISSRISDEMHAAIQSATVARSERLFDEVDEIVRKVGQTLWERTSRNPAPVALMATAVGLLANERKGGSSDGTGLFTQAKEALASQASEMAAGISSAAGDAGSGIAGVAGDAQAMAHDLAQKAPSPGNFWHEQPLTVGLLAAGLGFVAALSVPQPEQERNAIAPLVDKAQQQLDQIGVTDSTGSGDGGMIGKLKETGSELLGSAKEAATESLTQAGEAMSSVGDAAARSAKSPQGS